VQSNPSAADIADWLRLTFQPGDVLELRILDFRDNTRYPPVVLSGYFDCAHVDTLAAVAFLHTSMATGCFVTMNPVHPALLGRTCNSVIKRPRQTTTDSEIMRRVRLVFDADPVRPAGISATDAEKVLGFAVIDRLASELTARGWPAPILADSGNGFHADYSIDLPNDPASTELIKRVLLAASQLWSTPAVKIDTSLSNASRIVKLYGTLARKGDPLEDRPHRWSRVLSAPATPQLVTLDQLEALAAEIQSTPGPTVQPNGQTQNTGWTARVTDGASPEVRARAYVFAAGVPKSKDGEKGHNALYRVACELIDGFGLSFAQAMPIFEDWNQANASPPETKKQLEHKLSDAIKTHPAPSLKRLNAPRPGSASTASTASSKRPEIKITTERHEVTRQALAALLRDQRLYLRGEALATAYRCPETSEKLFGGIAVRNANGASRIRLVTEPAAGCFLTENATFYKMVKEKDEWVRRDCHPPDWLIRSVLAWHERPCFRPLLGVAECPYIGRDGLIVSEPGYDPATGTLLSPAFKLGPIPDPITKNQITDALARLNWLVKDFPFEDGLSFSVWLAALLTAIQRPMIAGSVPGFAFIGNKAGCGKGLLVDVIGRLVFGGPVPAFQYPEDKTESEKVMISLALGGVQAVHFDNLTEGQFYGNSSFDSALTCLVKGGRILGGHQNADIPLRPWWVLSGNNLSPGKDAYRRWLPCNLVTDLERPHERKDVSSDELRTHVTEHRSKIVTDALTILVAHARAGRPSHGEGKLGSFEEWDGIVRAAVHFATGNDCLATQRLATDDSPDRLLKLALLEAWYSELPDQEKNGYTVSEVFKQVGGVSLYPNLDQALSALGEKDKPIEPKKLGYFIRSLKNTNIGGFKFVDTKSKRNNTVAWKVTKT
jgi:hypothetical protein